MTPGVYQLILLLQHKARIQVGRLGIFDFPSGRYIYTGSALGGLEARIARHRRTEKRLHWHIDYFLRYVHIEEIIIYPTQQRIECDLNRMMLTRFKAHVVAPRFGSSDCRCPSHLIYLGNLVE